VVRCGVPHGSVLGPLLFLIYVNDMVRASGELGSVLFADDTYLFAEGGDPVELYGRINKGLGELGRWFRCNRLTLNLKKMEYVYFSRTRPPEVPQGGDLRLRGTDQKGGGCGNFEASGSTLG
jgi:hypothetical protein